MSTEPFNEYAQRCRYILAKMDLLENRMNDIYEDFTYFDALARKGIASDNYLALRNELKTAYDSLLIEDLQKPISEGVYFSDYQDGNHHPLMLLKISKGSNGLEAIQLQGGQVANDNMLRKYGGVLRGSEILQNNETLMYNAFWSGTRSRRPNTEMAHSTVEESQKFKEEQIMADGLEDLINTMMKKYIPVIIENSNENLTTIFKNCMKQAPNLK